MRRPECVTAPLRAALGVAAIAIVTALPWHAASAQTPPLPAQTCQLGDLTLESGEVIRDFKMTYITFGKLNADKSNAILSIHGLQGNRNTQTVWTRPGGAFDTNKYFVIQPDTLGAATNDPNATTSPTRSGLNMAFPRFNIRDMVKAEHRMLTECLGIKKLVAVAGSSMGGIESMQWAVSFPDFMHAVFPQTPMARANRQGNFIWESIRQAIMLDPKWQDGNYANDDPPRAGIGVALQIQTVVGWSAAGFEEAFTTREQVHAFHAQGVKNTGSRVQPRDWIYRSWAIQSHNIGDTPGFKGDFAAAARSIKARVVMFPNCHDQLHPPREGGVLEAMQYIPAAKLVDYDDIGGHRASTGAKALGIFSTEVRDLLKRIEDGRPGIGGPRIPKNFTRPDYCPR